MFSSSEEKSGSSPRRRSSAAIGSCTSTTCCRRAKAPTSIFSSARAAPSCPATTTEVDSRDFSALQERSIEAAQQLRRGNRDESFSSEPAAPANHRCPLVHLPPGRGRVRRRAADGARARSRPRVLQGLGNNTKYFQWNKKKGPYRVALDNGFIGNTWR